MKNNNINLGHMQVMPLNTDKSTVALIEQLNGLLDRYNALIEIQLRCPTITRLAGVLYSLEKTIEALCLKITEVQGIIAIKE